MANNYLQFSTIIPDLTKEEREWCSKRLERLSQGEWAGESPFRIDFQWAVEEDGSLWIYSDESGSADSAAKFVQLFLRKFRPESSHHFEWAMYCSKLRVDEFTGGGFLITSGHLEYLGPHTTPKLESLKKVLDRASKSGQSEARELADFILDSDELMEDPKLLLSSLEEFEGWLRAFKGAAMFEEGKRRAKATRKRIK